MAEEPTFERSTEPAIARATVAILYKNGGRFEIAPRRENRQWTLLGSGVLASSGKVLSTGHVVGHSRHRRFKNKGASVAVFIPGAGIFEVKKVRSEGGNPSRLDYMHLLLLKKRVVGVPIVPPDLVSRSRLVDKNVSISSFGKWDDAGGIPPGLNRSVSVGLRSRNPVHWLDLQWRRDQKEPVPGPGSSGGPVVFSTAGPEWARVVGLIRELTTQDVIASWVSTDRWNRKDRLERLRVDRPIGRNAGQLPLIALERPQGTPGAWTVPLGRFTRTLVVTLNATRLCRFSVLDGGNREEEALARLGTKPSGRFMVRKVEGPAGPVDAITVALAGVNQARDVRAQLRWS